MAHTMATANSNFDGSSTRTGRIGISYRGPRPPKGKKAENDGRRPAEMKKGPRRVPFSMVQLAPFTYLLGRRLGVLGVDDVVLATGPARAAVGRPAGPTVAAGLSAI